LNKKYDITHPPQQHQHTVASIAFLQPLLSWLRYCFPTQMIKLNGVKKRMCNSQFWSNKHKYLISQYNSFSTTNFTFRRNTTVIYIFLIKELYKKYNDVTATHIKINQKESTPKYLRAKIRRAPQLSPKSGTGVRTAIFIPNPNNPC
jgi:hypothetical protein